MSTLYDKIDNFYNDIVKLAYIRKLPNGKYRVYSKKGKNLGTYPSESKAKERLKQVEFFKKKASEGRKVDLSKLDKLTYSSVMRELVKLDQSDWIEFVKLYKKKFDKYVLDGESNFEDNCLKDTLEELEDEFEIIYPKQHKTANLQHVGSPDLIGKYIADIIRFTLIKISPKNRHKATVSVKNKILNLNAIELATKKMPASASMGQSITFVKSVLFGHDPAYIKQVINFIYKYL